ncbi:hypothetical protein RP75_28570 [Agrobacterium arsenijevicii]|uniref:Uncharacterized protein n=1 Tax=Agrobacterium arsenijevicii TaxID=1585697 RepID=A0ABR5CZN4_9HYPH|nr:hypothetical protein RP75_28570 [Agrobacterium arsenijevicii]
MTTVVVGQGGGAIEVKAGMAQCHCRPSFRQPICGLAQAQWTPAECRSDLRRPFRQPSRPLPSSALRGRDAYANVIAIEGFIDRLAAVVGINRASLPGKLQVDRPLALGYLTDLL